jgi:hypothetical protein
MVGRRDVGSRLSRLGDRTEACLLLLLPRPGGGTPGDYVDELTKRFALTGIEI